MIKNPVDEEKIKKIAEISANTLKKYGTEYMKAFKDCLVENIAEGKSSSDVKQKEPAVAISFINSAIVNTETKTKAGKKYTAYNTQVAVIKSKGSYIKVVPIRYSQFRTFNEQFKGKSKHLPAVPPKKMFNKMDKKVIEERSADFQSYLKALTALPNIHNDEQLQKFLSIKTESPDKYSVLYNKAFKMAYVATCAEMNIKPAQGVSSEVDALAELVNDVVNAEVRPDIEKNLPKDPKLLALVTPIMDAAIGTAVEKGVQTAWAGVSSSLNAARKSIIEVFESKTKIFVEANQSIKNKINDTISKALDPAVNSIAQVGQQVGYPLAKGVTVMSQELIKLKEANLKTLGGYMEKAEVDDKKLNEYLLANVGNFKKATSPIEEAVKLAATAGKEVFPILSDVTGIFQTVVDVITSHLEIISNAITKVFVDKNWAEKELSKEPTRNKFMTVVEEMQSRIRKITIDTIVMINKKSADNDTKLTKAFEKYASLSSEVTSFVAKLPGYDLDALETFRNEFGNKAKEEVVTKEDANAEINFVSIFRNAMVRSATIAMDFTLSQGLSSLNEAVRATTVKASLFKLEEELIPQCLEYAKPISDNIPAILKDMGFDLPQLVSDSVTEKAGEAVEKVIESIETSVKENLKSMPAVEEEK